MFQTTTNSCNKFIPLNGRPCRDFYNNCVPGVTQATGPREPWHDCHAKVEGPVAVDLVSNFVDRVKKQGRESLPYMYAALREPEFALKVKFDHIIYYETQLRCGESMYKINVTYPVGIRVTQSFIIRSLFICICIFLIWNTQMS